MRCGRWIALPVRDLVRRNCDGDIAIHRGKGCSRPFPLDRAALLASPAASMKSPSLLLAVSFVLLAGCASTPPVGSEAALKKRFSQVDVSGDGKISRDEFTDFMIEEAFVMYDKDGKGYVTLEEYVAGGGTEVDYRKINKSGSGKVTLAETKSSDLVRRQMSKPFDEADADSGGTGYVSYDEFVAFRGKMRDAVR